jgi:hypothetical protein
MKISRFVCRSAGKNVGMLVFPPRENIDAYPIDLRAEIGYVTG